MSDQAISTLHVFLPSIKIVHKRSVSQSRPGSLTLNESALLKRAMLFYVQVMVE
jgi:hypothetical protein